MGDNKAVMRRYLEDVWAKADYDAEKELVAEDIVDHNPVPGFPDGLEGHHQFLTLFHAAFTDIDITIHDVIADRQGGRRLDDELLSHR